MTYTPSSPSGAASAARRRRAALAACVVVGAVGFGIASPAPPGARAAEEPVTQVGTFQATTVPPGTASVESYQSDVQLFPEPAMRRLYTLGRGWLAVYDLDTFAPVGGGVQLFGGGEARAITNPSTGGLLVVVTENLTSRTTLFAIAPTPSGPVVAQSTDLTPQLLGNFVGAVHHVPGSDAIWMLSAPQVTKAPVSLTEVGVPAFESGAGAASVRWNRTLDGCPKLMHGSVDRSSQMLYGRDRTALYFGCASDHSGRGGVGRLGLTLSADGRSASPGAFALFPVAGDSSGAEMSVDSGGSRLLFPTYSSVTGVVQHVFDARTETYVGGVALGTAEVIQAGVDPVKGRFYGMASAEGTGLVVADTRPTPGRQGISLAKWSRRGGKAPDFGDLAVDPVTSRLFVQYAQLGHVVVLRDNLPSYVAPPWPDPDRNTADVDEEPGRTSVTYGSVATGFGTRFRQVGGLDALYTNTTSGFALPGGTPARPGTRELRTSSLDRLTLGNDESTADVIAAIPDKGATLADFDAVANVGRLAPHDPRTDAPPTKPDSEEPLFEPLPAGWPYQPARCVDLGDSPGQGHSPTGASASCAARSRATNAAADYAGAGTELVVVGRSSIRASAKVDGVRGVITTVTATAENVEMLAGALRFGKVTTTATTRAKGRPGTARGEFTTVIEDVRTPDDVLCEKNCSDLQALATEINARFTGRARVAFPQPDPVGLRGSKGGYQAYVTRVPEEHLEQVLHNEQPADRLDVPGMVITVMQDKVKPGRTVVELAAVEAESYYGISLQSTDGAGSEFESLGGPGGSGAAAGLSTDGAAPLFGLSPGSAESNVLAPLVTPPPGGVAAAGTDSAAIRAGRLIWNGLRRSVGFLPVWAVLLAPIYLSARRWLLFNREALVERPAS